MEHSRYTVKATTYDKPFMTISYQVPDLREAMFIAIELQMAFQKVDIIDNTTGEVMYDCYYASDNFTSFSTPDQAIQTINRIFGGNKNNGDN